MGLGIGIDCERCGEQLSYNTPGFEEKESGYDHDLCGDCVKERQKKEFDEKYSRE